MAGPGREPARISGCRARTLAVVMALCTVIVAAELLAAAVRLREARAEALPRGPEAAVWAWCKGCRRGTGSVPCPRCGGPACAACGRCPPCDGPVPDDAGDG